MAYNNGNFSLFNQTGFTSSTQVFAERIVPTFAPPAGSSYTNVYGSLISPSIISTGTSVGTIYGLAISLAISASGGTISNAYSMAIAASTVTAGSTVSNVYALYVSSPSTTGTGTFGNSYTVSIGGLTGIGTTTPKNMLDVFGSVAIGSYAGNVIAPANNVIVSGSVSIGTLSPTFSLDVRGAASALSVTAPGTMVDNQKITLAQGYDQGGFGGGSVGTNKPMSSNTTLTFIASQLINSNCTGFNGAAFDGRYIYLPSNTGLNSVITRYDTTQSFGASASYSYFSVAVNINSNCGNFDGAVFDGRYVYFIPLVATNGVGYSGVITRYDTTLSFGSYSSYSIFDTGGNVNSNSVGFTGAIFDGRYLYFVPYNNNATYYGQITRYDTTLPFGTAASYAVFDTTANVNPLSGGYNGGAFDGRYAYFIPTFNDNGNSGLLLRYDTTLPFGAASSYQIFDTTQSGLVPNSVGFINGVFDGRYIYLVPFLSNTITRYDTTQSFLAASSYAYYNTSYIGTTYAAAVYDGRYIYFVPNSNGQITRFDTTQSFGISTSYTILNLASLNTNSTGFGAGMWDGRYVYFAAADGAFNRIDAYPGPQATAMAATQAPNGFSIGTFAGLLSLQSGLIVGGSVGVGTQTPANLLDIAGAATAQAVYGYMPQSQNQLITLAEGYGQGGMSGGSVGTNKTMSTNSTVVFDTNANVNSISGRFSGAVFDGRYLYFTSYLSGINFIGQITRYDTTQPFGVSSSYAIFNIGTYVSSFSVGIASGGSFDGRYIYYPSFQINTTVIGQLTQYNTTLPFAASTSYAFFNTETNLSSLCVGFLGSIFDGRYIYLVPNSGLITNSGTVVRYDTTLPFGTATSYSFFNMAANVNSFSLGFFGAAFDGRYIYFVPNVNGLGTVSGQITQYDTTQSFTAAASYFYYNTQNLNSNSAGFIGAVYDGRYIYFMPNAAPGAVKNGQITRYDTTQSFGASTSYAFFNTSTLNSNSLGFRGGVFDGRYLYLVPYLNGIGLPNGQITRYDTTQPFGLSTSYSLFDTTANVNSNSEEFFGAVFDGRYIYFAPVSNGQITRIDAYPGPATSGMFAATQASNGFTIGTGITNAITATTATAGGVTLPASPAGYIVFTINGTSQKIAYFNI